MTAQVILQMFFSKKDAHLNVVENLFFGKYHSRVWLRNTANTQNTRASMETFTEKKIRT